MAAKKFSDPASALLVWYDRNKRDLPWRATADTLPDPYHVWLSEIMLQQTTVAAVKPYYEKFLNLFPTIGQLAAADQQDVLRAWAGLGYYSRARNLHACAQAIVRNYQGQFPDEYDLLKALPGIGDYTASAILAIAFSKRAIVIDGNVERVTTRLRRIETVLPAAKNEIRAYLQEITPHQRCGDFAQAMMDLGATLCTPRNPACGLCPFSAICLANRSKDAESFPRKAPKTARPRRFGHAFVLVREDGTVLLRDRPAKGLLGGMSEVPNTDWTPAPQAFDAGQIVPIKAKWAEAPDTVHHIFTHFELHLSVHAATVSPKQKAPPDMRFVPLATAAQEALPSVMKKALAAGLKDLGIKI